MSVLKLELKEEHIKLLSNLRWSMKDNIVSGIKHDGEEFMSPFNGDNLYEEIDLILNGMPENFDPFNTEEPKRYSDEQKAEWDKLYSELPLALDIVLFNKSFELGTHKTKWHDRNWKKIV
jgi:hypothetical protein